MRQEILRALGHVILAGGLLVAPAVADERPDDTPGGSTSQPKYERGTIDLLDAMRNGQVDVAAKGTGDGRMSLALTNRTRFTLRVVLPAGLIGSGASGQVGAVAGGWGVNFGFGGGFGGFGGGLGGGFGGGGIIPLEGRTIEPWKGLDMFGRTIMASVGDRSSWDQNSLLSIYGVGQMGIGPVGAPMAGQGGIRFLPAGPNVGNGFRSIPPTGLSFVHLEPEQSSGVVAPLVSLQGPSKGGKAVMPAKGEVLALDDLDAIHPDPIARAALRRLAEDKAPPAVAQLVMWHVGRGVPWERLRSLSTSWANDHERALARDLVDRLRNADDVATLPADEAGTLYVSITGRSPETESQAHAIRGAFGQTQILGLTPREDVPDPPLGPAVAIEIELEEAVARVQFSSSSAKGSTWERLGKLSLPLYRKGEAVPPAEFVDDVAGALLNRLADATLIAGKPVKGKIPYALRIDNASPMILNGFSLSGSGTTSADVPPASLSGAALPPHRSALLPVSTEAVDRLGLKAGVKFLAADFSAL